MMFWTIAGRIALTSWIATSQADAALTGIALAHGAREVNPVVAAMPPWAFPVVKSSLGVVTVWGVEKYRKDHPKLVFWIAVGGTVGYGLINVHNWHVIQAQKRDGQ